MAVFMHRLHEPTASLQLAHRGGVFADSAAKHSCPVSEFHFPEDIPDECRRHHLHREMVLITQSYKEVV
jgi:hypothetical protein